MCRIFSRYLRHFTLILLQYCHIFTLVLLQTFATILIYWHLYTLKKVYYNIHKWSFKGKIHIIMSHISNFMYT